MCRSTCKSSVRQLSGPFGRALPINSVGQLSSRCLAALLTQSGNMASSGSSQIEASVFIPSWCDSKVSPPRTAGGENLRTTSPSGADIPDYARVLQIFLAVVAGWLILLCLIGDEAHSAEFEKVRPYLLIDRGADGMYRLMRRTSTLLGKRMWAKRFDVIPDQKTWRRPECQWTSMRTRRGPMLDVDL